MKDLLKKLCFRPMLKSLSLSTRALRLTQKHMEHYPLQTGIVLSSRLLETPGSVATTSLYISFLRSTILFLYHKPNLFAKSGAHLSLLQCVAGSPHSSFPLYWQRRYFSLLNRPHLTPQNLTAQIICLILYYTQYNKSVTKKIRIQKKLNITAKNITDIIMRILDE